MAGNRSENFWLELVFAVLDRFGFGQPSEDAKSEPNWKEVYYNATLQLYVAEGDRIWTRFSILLGFHLAILGALVAGYAGGITPRVIYGGCLFGIVLVWFWSVLNGRGWGWHSRYRNALKKSPNDLENPMKLLNPVNHWVCSSSGTNQKQQERGGSPNGSTTQNGANNGADPRKQICAEVCRWVKDVVSCCKLGLRSFCAGEKGMRDRMHGITCWIMAVTCFAYLAIALAQWQYPQQRSSGESDVLRPASSLETHCGGSCCACAEDLADCATACQDCGVQ